MKTLQWCGESIIRVSNEVEPVPSPDEVLVRIAYCGICGSDLHVLEGWTTIAPPAVLGHEFSGTVYKVGANVRSFKGGEHVAVHPLCPCGTCSYCRRGQANLCTSPLKLLGSRDPGGLSEYVIARPEQLYALDESVPLARAVLAEPLSVAVHAIDLAHIETGSSAVVVGGGPIGVLCLKVAQQAGASVTILSEPSAYRRTLAEAVGATVAVTPSDLVETVKAMTGALGADVGIEAVGRGEAFEQCLRVTRRGGAVMIAGWAPLQEEVAISPGRLYLDEKRIGGVFWSTPSAFDVALRLLRMWGPQLDQLITVYQGLESFTDAVNAVRKKEALKAVIRITD